MTNLIIAILLDIPLLALRGHVLTWLWFWLTGLIITIPVAILAYVMVRALVPSRPADPNDKRSTSEQLFESCVQHVAGSLALWGIGYVAHLFA